MVAVTDARLERMFPFTVEVAPVANASPGCYRMLGHPSGEDGAGTQDEENKVNVLTISNDSGAKLYVRTTPAVSCADAVVNGAFDADTNWGVHSGWTIGSGVALHATGTSFPLSQEPMTEGAAFANVPAQRGALVVFKVANRNAGDVRFTWGGSGANKIDGAVRTTNATFTEWVRYPDWNTDRRFDFLPTSDFDGDIDDVKLYPDAAYELNGAYDLIVPDGETRIIGGEIGIRTERVGIWVPTGGNVAKFSIWGCRAGKGSIR